MNVFEHYAKYYDLLYQDKDYQAESNFLIDILNHYGVPHSAKLLELGVGTAKHACFLAEQGYFVTGVEQSETMLEIAGQMISQQNHHLANHIQLNKGDIRNWESTEKFDAALSLFHVVSYMTTLEDLKKVFNNVKQHVKPGGHFIFDCWYGPAVLNLKPETRFKVMEDQDLRIERVAIPTMDENHQNVVIDYILFVKDKEQTTFQKFEEQHHMRFLFPSEIHLLCEKFDFYIEDQFEWMTKAPLSQNTWGACFVIKV